MGLSHRGSVGYEEILRGSKESAQDISCISFKRCKDTHGNPLYYPWLFGLGFWPVTPFRGRAMWVHGSQNYPQADV